jgi:hypothetical protein
MVPEIMARIDKGNVMVKNTLRREPDSIFALLMISLSMFSNPSLADLKRNGDATKVSAITTAKVLPGMMNPGLLNKGPSSPFGAKVYSNATPATAGGNTMGKSIIVSRIVFPGKLLVTMK